MIAAGIDGGAQYTKAVVIKDFKIIGKSTHFTNFDLKSAGETALYEAMRFADISKEKIARIGKTGRSVPKTDGLPVDPMAAMVAAARFFFPEAATVTDIGAEDGRTVRMDEKGNVIDSAGNERCAAGAGMFIETMARLINCQIGQMGPLALSSDQQIPLNAQCVLFAESEVVELMRNDTSKADISRAVHEAMASRIVTLISRIGITKELVMMGGVAKNPAIIAFIREKLRMDTILIPDDPEYAMAVGAALVASKNSRGSLI